MRAMTATVRRCLLVLLATLTVTVSACAGSGTSNTTQNVAGGALGFAGATVDGGAFDGATLAGAPTVLWFWAPL
jgi:hypothetical protein